MGGLMGIKFKKSKVDDWYHKVENGVKGPSFTNRGEIGKKLWLELQDYIDKGGIVEQAITQEEQAVIDQEHTERVLEDQKEKWYDKLSSFLEVGQAALVEGEQFPGPLKQPRRDQ